MSHKDYIRFEDVPSEVWFVKGCEYFGTPIGASLYEEVITKYPEYFPEEVEHRRKWDSVPKEVKDAYWKEYWAEEKEIMKGFERKGLIYYIQHPEEKDNFSEEYEIWKPLLDALEKRLHKKYYSKYGL